MPIERDDASATISETGKRRSARISSISRPTLPVAPTTATLYAIIKLRPEIPASKILEGKADRHVARRRNADRHFAAGRTRLRGFLLFSFFSRRAPCPATSPQARQTGGRRRPVAAAVLAPVRWDCCALAFLGLRLRRDGPRRIERARIDLKLLGGSGPAARRHEASGEKQRAERKTSASRHGANLRGCRSSVLNRRRGGIKAGAQRTCAQRACASSWAIAMFFSSAIAFAGDRLFGQTWVQFMIVWQR